MKARDGIARWRGVRMRRLYVGADADAPTRLVTVPASWGDDSAAGLAALAPGCGPVALADAAAAWLGRLAATQEAGAELAEDLAAALLRRAAAPGETVWRGGTGTAAYVINLGAFAPPGGGFDTGAYVGALGTAARALRLLGGRAGIVLLGNLDACLAALGLDYAGEPARAVAACLTALASATVHPDAVSRHGRTAMPPACAVAPELSARAAAAWRQAAARTAEPVAELFGDLDRIETGFSIGGATDALLGFEACGIAPVFSPLTQTGALAESTQARLAARGISSQAAFAASLAGRTVLPVAGLAAIQAMLLAVRPFIDRIPPVAASAAAAPTPWAAIRRRELPARHGGFTQKAVVGGHRLYLRTGEYEDGSLGELMISPVRDGPAQRGLMEAFGQAVSIGLQHGVPLAAYVEAFAYTRFGPQGDVGGDATIGSASSMLDYAFRTLSHAYLGRSLPDVAPRQGARDPDAETLLPLDLPHTDSPAIRERHGLRLVG